MLANFFFKDPKSAPLITPEPTNKPENNKTGFNNIMNEDQTMSIISKGATLEGNITVDGSLKIDGYLKGEVICSSSVIIGEDGTLEGTIKAASMQVAGIFKGIAEIDGECIVSSTGTVSGELAIGSFNFISGATMNGSINMKGMPNTEISDNFSKPAKKVTFALKNNIQAIESMRSK